MYAIDMVGFGFTDKLFSFDNPQLLRVNHIWDFMQLMCIDEASFIGNSFGGGFILSIASENNPVLKIKKIITVSGGGPLDPSAFEILNNYDCTEEYMKKILDLLYMHHSKEIKPNGRMKIGKNGLSAMFDEFLNYIRI
ncbi:pimeloyl-ACP methyl ester carboxylesterase [Neobacillus niacini]|nr:pimeloyl-ACP methyl ester carboxylesterase [Neobacillus niacini]